MTRPAPEILWDLDPDQATTVWAVGQGLGWQRSNFQPYFP